MDARNKLAGMPYMINVIELLIEKFLNYEDDELNRRNLAVLLSTLKRFEKNVKQRQIERGYKKRKMYMSREEKDDIAFAKRKSDDKKDISVG